jgi:predicted enzyme related to lactoylglutathione lyase
MRVQFGRMMRWIPRGLAIAGICCLLAPAAAVADFEVPPIGGPGAIERHPGKVVWADLVTPDLAGAEHFYSGMFSWTFQQIRPEYAVALLGGRPIGGMVQRPIPTGQKRQPGWLTFIAVPDLEAADKLALAHGAKSLAPPKSYPRRGSQAVFADPEGAVFAMLSSTTGDSADYLATPGEWIWSSLLSADPTKSAGFYKAVFGYEIYDLPSDDGVQHVILASDDYARAGIHTLPPQHLHAHWLNFVRVIDTEKATVQAVTLGGRVLVEPYIDRHGGHVAIIADPYGAPLGLMEWTAADSQADPAVSPAPALPQSGETP